MADRVLVMHEGRLTAELSRAEADEESVIRAATGQDAGGRGVSVQAAPAPIEGAKARRMVERVFRVRELGIVVALALLIAVTAVLEPRFIEAASLRNLALNASIFAILAAGQTLVIITRNVDLSVGSVLGLSAYPRRRPALQAPGHGAAGRLPARDRPRRRVRPVQRHPRHLGKGAGARGDARHALHVPRLRLPVDGRHPGQRRDASRRVPERRDRVVPRRAVPGHHHDRRRAGRRPVAARLPRRPRAVRDRIQPGGRLGSPACGRTGGC